jgi:hypothetical protein
MVDQVEGITLRRLEPTFMNTWNLLHGVSIKEVLFAGVQLFLMLGVAMLMGFEGLHPKR